MSNPLLTYLAAEPMAFSLLAALLGLLIGSFLNVVIYRLPVILERQWHQQCAELQGTEPAKTETWNLIVPRSRCPHCGHAITALENIPVISYLILRGKCSDCGARISPRYPAVELLTAILTGMTAWHFGYGLTALGAILFTWAMIALSFIDYDTHLLPDVITLPLLWIGLMFNLKEIYAPLNSAVIGVIAGYLFLWMVFQLFKLITKKEGMGFGDFKLFALFGAWLGWQSLPLVILLASATGAVIGLGMILLLGRDRQLPIPFGPFLCIAGWIGLLWGEDLLAQYLQLFRVGGV